VMQDLMLSQFANEKFIGLKTLYKVIENH
jgi:hypothetical protein